MQLRRLCILGPVTAFVRSRAPHWVLVWTVVFAVIGMHHLSTRAEHGLGTHAEHGHAPAATACCTHGTPKNPRPTTTTRCTCAWPSSVPRSPWRPWP